MDLEENAEGKPALGIECRESPRLPVNDDAKLTLIGQDSSVPCTVLDLSQGGCRLRAKQRLKVRPRIPVEVTFKIRGLPMLLCGVIQWTDYADMFGIRFVDVSSRRKEMLAELIGEIEAIHAGELKRLGNTPSDRRADPRVMAPPAQPGSLEIVPRRQPAELQQTDIRPDPQPAQPTQIADAGEDRVRSRQEVDTSAFILLIRSGAKLSGRIVDLSLGGCRIRTDELFPQGIYTRVDLEFRLEEQPFRLSGVIQHIQDRRFAGIRFMDLSDGKKEQLEQLIREVEEMSGRGNSRSQETPEHSD